MKTRFEKTNGKELIIFLTGWGCDDVQFENMLKNNTRYDILLCWDYSDLEFPNNIDFSVYENIYLLTYSAGVFVAGLIGDKLPKFTKSVAINGNPLMFDNRFGISEETLRVFRELNLENYIDFRRKYLVYTEEELEFFNNNSSVRTFESCNEELDKLEEFSKTDFCVFPFDIAILSDNDKIFNPESQAQYFDGKYIRLKNSAHNIFYKLQSFEAVIELINSETV